MKLRALQVLFVAASLLFAALIVRHGEPHLLPASQAQQRPGGPDGLEPPMQEAGRADRQAAVASVQAQLDAFQKGDFLTASRYQSRAMRQHIQSVAAFRLMMQTEYSAFLHFQSVSYGVAQTPDGGGHVLVPITLHMADRTQFEAVYIMVREDGVYRVAGAGRRGGLFPGPPAGDGDGRMI